MIIYSFMDLVHQPESKRHLPKVLTVSMTLYICIKIIVEVRRCQRWSLPYLRGYES